MVGKSVGDRVGGAPVVKEKWMEHQTCGVERTI